MNAQPEGLELGTENKITQDASTILQQAASTKVHKMVPALHSEESMGQLRSKSGTGKHFVYIPGNGAKRQLISVRVDVHYQGTGVYRSPERVFY